MNIIKRKLVKLLTSMADCFLLIFIFQQTQNSSFTVTTLLNWKDCCQALPISMRKGNQKFQGKPISASLLNNKQKLSEMMDRDKGLHYIQACCGSPEYWKHSMSDLVSMVR